MTLDFATETARIDAAQRQLEHSVRAYQEAQRDLLASDGRTPEVEALRFAAEALKRKSAYAVSSNGRPALSPVERL